MHYTFIKGYNIPKLSLGTVALGMRYGISNQGGKPSAEESFRILSAASEAGITCFDTARSYGDAEELIGNFMRLRTGEITVVTKFKIASKHLTSRRKALEEVLGSLRTSLAALRLEQVPVCLFHMDRNLPLAKVMEVVPGILEALKSAGLIHLAGISADHPSEAEVFAGHPLVDALQIPVNVFDHRLSKGGTLREIAAAGKIVFARSIFLQGLFFTDPSRLTGRLVRADSALRELQKLAAAEGMNVAQLAFSYVRDLEGITSIVFGAETPRQVRNNVQLLNSPPLTQTCRSAIAELFGEMDEEIITPGRWRVPA